MEIAVLMNSDGATSGFDKEGMICVFSKCKQEWEVVRQMEYSPQNMMDAAALHTKIREICDWLSVCKIIVVNRIRGIHYIAFEERQVSMLEIKGCPNDFLNDIQECVQHRRIGQEVPIEHNTINMLQPGIYHTDLREVMKGNTSYSSKQILLPFLKQQQFVQLEILCDHVPKWLEKDQTQLRLRFSVEKFRDCMKVKIYPLKDN